MSDAESQALPAAPVATAAPPAGMVAAALAFLALAGPMIVSRLGLAAMGITDGVMLAHHDTRQFALHGLAESVVGRVFDVTLTFMMAGMALASQASTGDATQRLGVGRVWKLALWLSTGAGVLGALIGLLGAPLLRLSGQDPALADGAGRVIFVLCLGMLPAMWAMATAGVLEALGKPIGVAVAVITGNVLNYFFNSWLIGGFAGGPPLGAVGAALSTTLVRTLLAVVLLAFVWWLPTRREFGLHLPFTRADWQAGAEQRARGWSAAATVAVLAGLSLGLPVMAGWLGEGAVAEMTALFLALAPCMVVAWGLSDAAGLRIAALLGQPAANGELRGAGLRMAGLALAVLLPLCALYLWQPEALLRIGIPDAGLVERTVRLLPWGLAFVLAEGLSFVYMSSLRSLGELRRPFIAQLVCGLALLPLAYGLAFGWQWGVAGLVAAWALTAGVCTCVLAWLYDRAAAKLDRGGVVVR